MQCIPLPCEISSHSWLDETSAGLAFPCLLGEEGRVTTWPPSTTIGSDFNVQHSSSGWSNNAARLFTHPRPKNTSIMDRCIAATSAGRRRPHPRLWQVVQYRHFQAPDSNSPSAKAVSVTTAVQRRGCKGNDTLGRLRRSGMSARIRLSLSL
jgi:hypothetical protein